jgi:hypothetical protein
MAIKAPGWCPNAVPTLRGWKHPKRPEILKPAKITQAQIDEWHGVAPVAPAPVAPVVEEVVEEVLGDTAGLKDLSKKELEELGRSHGVELDRRKSKKTLISSISKLLN